MRIYICPVQGSEYTHLCDHTLVSYRMEAVYMHYGVVYALFWHL